MKKRNTALGTIAVILAFLLGIGLVFLVGPGNRDTGKLEPIAVGWSPWEHSALFYITEDQGYFGQNGLKVTSREYDFPATRLDGMLKGEVDIVVGSAEWPLVRRVFSKKPLCAIANIDRVSSRISSDARTVASRGWPTSPGRGWESHSEPSANFTSEDCSI